MLVTNPAVKKAALALFGPGAYINAATISKFEETYNCRIQKIKREPGSWFGELGTPTVTFNTEKDEIIFLLKWS